mmetsp:Transcript_44821/g.144142  ORF Transcript_44821/g.144142 Transcript_44821/m.144142 type:complete len:190 (-) Transcript_44821:630-1199(-)
MRDKERGVIWEECIVLAPSAARFVFLSATIPNGAALAGWLAMLRQTPCELVHSAARPVPLRHYVASARRPRDLFLVQSGDGAAFDAARWESAVEGLSPPREPSEGGEKKKKTPQAADPTAPPTRRLEQRCAAAAELLYALAGGAAGEASARGADGGGAGGAHYGAPPQPSPVTEPVPQLVPAGEAAGQR